MDQYLVRNVCPRCNGEGEYLHDIIVNEEVQKIMLPCEACNAIGYFICAKVDGAEDINWIKKKIKKILNKLGLPED